jgi:hypothetical protein
VRIGPPTHFIRALKLQAGLAGDGAAVSPAAAAASTSSEDESSGEEAADVEEAKDGGADLDVPRAGAGRGGGRGGGRDRVSGRGAGGRCLLLALPPGMVGPSPTS